MTWTGSPREFHQLSITAALQKGDDDLGHNQAVIDRVMRLGFYGGLTAVFLMIIALIVKLMWNCNGEEGRGGAQRATENTGLLSSKENVVFGSYGTSGEDLESGSSSTSSSEDLYDGKICVICYDDRRNCFFVPCGHCVACHTCASRIMKEDSKSCPICRGIIDKVRNLNVL